MKFTDSILTLVGDFAAMKRTPDYIPSNFPVEAQPMKSENNKSNNTRRHSLHISVGTEEIPKLGRNRSESVFSPSTLTDSKIYNKSDRRVSAPCINTAPKSSLRRKLKKIREKGVDSDDDTINEAEEEEACETLAQRRMSSSSVVYRI